VDVVIHVINDNGGTAQASDIQVMVYQDSQRASSTCSGPFSLAQNPFQGSESGTIVPISAPSCFFVALNNGPYSGYTVTEQCMSGQMIRVLPGQTTTCTETLNDNPP
jgi:hypothetical protein